jgi:hypothetical protein
VGIETNKFTASRGDGELRGSAQLAARFAYWLVENGVCRRERLTLMLDYNRKACEAGTYNQGLPPDRDLSPDDMLRKITDLAAPGEPAVEVVEHTNTTDDFRTWMSSSHGPRSTDTQFVLFWVGHGLTYPYRRLDRRLCLLGRDAGRDQLSHVELTNLLDAVSIIAPQVHVVALVDACQGQVDQAAEKALEDGFRAVSPPDGKQPKKSADSATRSVAFAAAPGQTTRSAGWQGRTFAEFVLDELDGLPSGQGPALLFDADPAQGIGARLRRSPRREGNMITFGYFHDGDGWLNPPPAPDFDVTDEEWQCLLEIASGIDSTAGAMTAAKVRWGALCHAIDLDQVFTKVARADSPSPTVSIKNMAELVDLLYGWPPQRGPAFPPPLIVACDFVANLPERDTYQLLSQWCQDWADYRGRDGRTRLDNAEHKRPPVPPDRDFLGVLVDNHIAPGDVAPGLGEKIPDRYLLWGFVWTFSGPRPLGTKGPIGRDQVAAAVEDLIMVADRLEIITSFDDLVIDLALPRDLIGRRLEYDLVNGGHEFGRDYAIAIRDLERLRGCGPPLARERAVATWQRMAGFKASARRKWSQQITWIDCDQSEEDKKRRIRDAIIKKKKFALAMEYGSAVAIPDGAPGDLAYSLDAGAAVVLSVHHERSCIRCAFRSAPRATGEPACTIPKISALLRKRINDANHRGLFDLPGIVRDLRPELRDRGIKVGVILDDQSRFWRNYVRLASGASAPGN